MPKQILAFGASNSRKSINKQFAKYAAHQIPDAEVLLLDLNDFEMPLYSIDREKEQGIPELAHQFRQHISAADAVVISFAEHNSSYTAAYKNIYDWISRIDRDIWQNKPMLLLSTAPGARGGKTVLAAAEARYQRGNTNQIITFSLPKFQDHFSPEGGIIEETLKKEFEEKLSAFMEALGYMI
jgi:chromate reductase